MSLHTPPQFINRKTMHLLTEPLTKQETVSNVHKYRVYKYVLTDKVGCHLLTEKNHHAVTGSYPRCSNVT